MVGERGEKKNAITFHYVFNFEDGSKREFRVELDKSSLSLVTNERKFFPEWTSMSFCRCSNCPLDKNETRYCPMAVNIVDLVEFFKDQVSFKKVHVKIHTNERTYSKHATVQEGVSSLLGIYMVSGGCPVMEKLKPMVRFHLPFATVEETTYRVISMYLFAQYFLYRRGEVPDWDLKNLVKIYDEIRKVNDNFCKRLRKIITKDANVNALVILDNFANYVNISISADFVTEHEYLFDAYFKCLDETE